MQQLESITPLSSETVSQLSNEQVAIVDQFIFRFAKLQDAMGAQLFPGLIDQLAEPGPLPTFIDKLLRLEKIGALDSAQEWIELRETRNQIAHDYPDDPEYQASLLNLALKKAARMLTILTEMRAFSEKYH
jgi:hypothetical protein